MGFGPVSVTPALGTHVEVRHTLLIWAALSVLSWDVQNNPTPELFIIRLLRLVCVLQM